MDNSNPVMMYVLGYLESTIGSNREYTLDDLRRRMQIAVKVLKGERDEALDDLYAKDAQRQKILDGDLPSVQ